MGEVTDVKDLGSGVIGGRECDHLAFRTADVDWQIWIAQGDAPVPLPLRDHLEGNVPGAPQYQLDVRDWRTAIKSPADDFAFKAPADAKKVELKDIADIDELPDPGARRNKMSASKKLGIFLLAGIVGLCGLELGQQLSIPGVHSFVSSAEAIVGRPLTPVSYAGVARRTVRRCAVGVYYC